MGFLNECSNESHTNSRRPSQENVEQSHIDQNESVTNFVSNPCFLPNVNFTNFIDASPVDPSLVVAGSQSHAPGECMTKVDDSALKPVNNYVDDKSLIEQELALEEEELLLKRKRLMFAKMTAGTSSTTSKIDCVPMTQPDYVGSIEESLRRLTLGIGLPKLEIDPFSGCASDYVTFVSSFHSQIVSQVNDPYQKLCYLIFYCRGVAKEAIKHCALLPKHTCFDTAMGILKSQFGRPHQIIQSVTQDLYTGPSIRGTDQQSLTCLLRQMRSCQITLSQLNRSADLDCTTNLSKVIRRLPKPLQVKWAEIAESLLSIGKEVTFVDLLSLVERRVAMGSTDYGIIAFGEPAPRTLQPTRRVATAISSQISNSCPLCDRVHTLNACSPFVNMTVSDRWETLKKHKCCFRCLKSNHRIRNCKSTVICGVNGCSKIHHRLLHMERDAADRSDVKVSGRICNSYNPLSTQVHLGFVPVRIEGENGSVCTYAFLDNGSDCSLIDQAIVKELGLYTVPKSISVSTLHGLRNIKCHETRAKISSLNRSYSVDLNPLIAVDRLPIHEVDKVTPDLSKWSHLSDVRFDRLASKRVGLLIGCDIPKIHEVLEQRMGSNKEPFAFKSVLGWILRGPTGSNKESVLRINTIASEPSLEDMIHRLYNNEFQDGEHSEEIEPSVDDMKAVDTVKASSKLIDGHYQLAVPWRSTNATLPDNYNLAVRRLDCLKRKLLKDGSLFARYALAMRGHIEKGHIREGRKLPIRWYLPHHPVINPKKPEKLRIVFDCAATFRGVSLNDTLLQGPDIANKLVGVLHRFRRYSVALSADIKEMFLQVRLPEKDKWAFSLLWWENGNPSLKPKVYEWNVHPFGATSSPFCANYSLRQTFDDHIVHFESVLDKGLLRQFYVDDFLGSTSSIDQATSIVSALPQLLKCGGFDLVKWNSNRKEVISKVEPENRLSSVRDLFPSEVCQRTLGIKWHTDRDVFVFELVDPVNQPTRRTLLSYVASIFDPLGFIAPLVLPGKIVLQDVCRLKLGWDTKLEEKKLCAYKDWIEALSIISTFEVPRCLIPDPKSSLQFELHVLSDASEYGYGAVGYLCYKTLEGARRCRFLMGKARVAPLKFVTIPRLELTAALMASLMSHQLKRELDIPLARSYLWTDSSIVLSYLSNTSTRYVTFVANRVRRILELTGTSEWRHVPTKENPADVASRGIGCKPSAKLFRWIDGPVFLMENETRWPKHSSSQYVSDESLEIKRVAATVTQNDLEWFKNVVARCSSWMALLRRIVWLSRFKRFIRIKTKAEMGLRMNIGNIKLDELNVAKDDILRLCQSQAFPEGSKSIALKSLKPIIVNGIICLGGRVKSTRQRHLPILPANCQITDLIVDHYHRMEGHSGASHVLATLRSRYWLIKGMAMVRRRIRKCFQCKVLWTQPCQQAMADLPSCRIDEGTYPFQHCGLDYFGPFQVTYGRKHVKRFGCLFTCMQTRAVHIEVAHDLSTDSFLMALTRFMCRRGSPTNIYSDNGSNFIGAEKELRSMLSGLEQKSIVDHLNLREVTWHFNPPYASHRGGSWERIIRSIRRILANIISKQIVTDEVLLSSFAEVERILNDRPLVPVYDDADNPIALRPSDLLLLRPNLGPFDDSIPLRERFTRKWKQAQHLVNVFWKRWKSEYLPTLQKIHKWLKPNRNLKVGDLVIISKIDSPRGQWPKGIVTETFPGSDNLVRQVSVRTSNGIEIRRDVRSLCLLEGSEE